jgi:DNA-binding MarR family transcriptional regulator
MSNARRSDKTPGLAERGLLFHLAVVEDLFAGALEARLAGAPLSARGFEVASVLVTRGPLSPGEIADITGVPAPSISKVVARMEATGLVRTSPHPTDGRSRVVALTRPGRRAFDVTRSSFGRLYDELATELGSSVDLVDWAVRRLEWGMRRLMGLSPPSPLESTPAARQLTYPGEPLTPDEETEALDFVDWLRHRRGTR